MLLILWTSAGIPLNNVASLFFKVLDGFLNYIKCWYWGSCQCIALAFLLIPFWSNVIIWFRSSKWFLHLESMPTLDKRHLQPKHNCAAIWDYLSWMQNNFKIQDWAQIQPKIPCVDQWNEDYHPLTRGIAKMIRI